MSLACCLMIEGQEGLTWERWRRLARAAEDGGYQGLFRSDHLTGLFGDPTRPALDTWASLAWLATGTARIRFGPLVCPLTFYHPAILARRAAAISELSGGRLDLGIGAGWHDGEHRMFGIPFPPLRERMDRLECGARVIRALWRGGPVTLDQPHAPLVDAQTTPRPAPGALPLVIGGRGERRTLRIVAEHADEWNVTRLTPDEYPAKLAVLEGHCRAVGRDPAEIRRSLMVPLAVGRTPAEVHARREKIHAIMPRLPKDAAEWRAAGFLHGSPEDVVRDLTRWEGLGMHRVMLQLLDQEDLAAIDLFAREVLPAFR
ncbi:MAG: TIGR03560 family F420-dependent LLM class oxidoreductase [Candidatus Rokubacteria bacterium]|nr:TIGR03560 family F420-dependent LLM class oxidoreductase [Candidatus Rokubacteria bacterium]